MNCVTGCNGPGDSGHVKTYYFYSNSGYVEEAPDEEKHPSWFELNRKFWQQKGTPPPRPMKSIPKSEVETKFLRWLGIALCGGQK